MQSNAASAIAKLNDNFRKDLTLGMAYITPGVAAMGPVAVERLVKTIAVYDQFTAKTDPWAERDFGVIRSEGKTVFFKIGYLDVDMLLHSPDPSNPDVTNRVITVMLAEEY